MKTLNSTSFYILFFIVVFIETVIANINGLESLHFISKPLIVCLLLYYFFHNSAHLNAYTRKCTTLALVCSLLGDVLLLLVYKAEFFFILGLIAFLTAHIMYSFVFWKQRNKAKKPYGFVSILIIYALGLFSLLESGLNNLLLPVVVYMLIILTMVTLAYLRVGNIKIRSYSMVFLGALLFMISDSILAINKFHDPILLADFSIMATYAMAQFFIIFGLLKETKSKAISY